MRNAAAAIVVLLLLVACGQPLPLDKAAYVGDWEAKDMRLLIRSDGHVEYVRRTGNRSSNINAPIQRFEGDNFVVGLGPFNTTFVVSRAPWRDGAVWRMTVDGVELVRRGGPDELRA